MFKQCWCERVIHHSNVKPAPVLTVHMCIRVQWIVVYTYVRTCVFHKSWHMCHIQCIDMNHYQLPRFRLCSVFGLLQNWVYTHTFKKEYTQGRILKLTLWSKILGNEMRVFLRLLYEYPIHHHIASLRRGCVRDRCCTKLSYPSEGCLEEACRRRGKGPRPCLHDWNQADTWLNGKRPWENSKIIERL